MQSITFAVGILLVGAIQAAAQGTDSAASRTNQTSGSAASSLATTDPADEDLTPHCWLGCRSTLNLQRSAPAEWTMSSHVRVDTLVAFLKRNGKPIVPPGVQQARKDTARLASDAARADGAQRPVAPVAATISPASEADGERYLIEEWRHSEAGIADSIHHDVLTRLSRLYDSAQRSNVSADARLRIVQQVDGMNALNQLMWLQRRADVNRQADSALRAVPAP